MSTDGRPGPTLEYNIKAWCSGGVSRPPSKRHDFGLAFEMRQDGGETNNNKHHFYVTKVEGLVKDFTEVRVGDQLYKFQDKPAAEYTSVEELEAILQDALKISIETLHPKVMAEAIPVVDLPLEKGDVVPLKDYKDKPELNGQHVQVIRKLDKGKLLVSPVGRKKEKLLITQANLHFDLEPEKITLKEYSSDTEEEEEEKNNKDEEEEKEEREETKKEDDINDNEKAEIASDQEDEPEKEEKEQEATTTTTNDASAVAIEAS